MNRWPLARRRDARPGQWEGRARLAHSPMVEERSYTLFRCAHRVDAGCIAGRVRSALGWMARSSSTTCTEKIETFGVLRKMMELAVGGSGYSGWLGFGISASISSL